MTFQRAWSRGDNRARVLSTRIGPWAATRYCCRGIERQERERFDEPWRRLGRRGQTVLVLGLQGCLRISQGTLHLPKGRTLHYRTQWWRLVRSRWRRRRALCTSSQWIRGSLHFPWFDSLDVSWGWSQTRALGMLQRSGGSSSSTAVISSTCCKPSLQWWSLTWRERVSTWPGMQALWGG